jgi:hypothetical protein
MLLSPNLLCQHLSRRSSLWFRSGASCHGATRAPCLSLASTAPRRSFSSADSSADGDAAAPGSKAPNPLRFVSHLKNPIVHQLWTARGAAKANAEEQRASLDLASPRSPAASETSVSYPFCTDEFLRETYRSPFGKMRCKCARVACGGGTKQDQLF